MRNANYAPRQSPAEVEAYRRCLALWQSPTVRRVNEIFDAIHALVDVEPEPIEPVTRERTRPRPMRITIRID